MVSEVLKLSGRCFEDPDPDHPLYAFETSVAITQTVEDILKDGSVLDIKKACLRFKNMVIEWLDNDTLPFGFNTFKDVVEVRVKGSVHRAVADKFEVRACMLLRFEENGIADVDVNQMISRPWANMGIDFKIAARPAIHCALKTLLTDLLLGFIDIACPERYYKKFRTIDGKQMWPDLDGFIRDELGCPEYADTTWVMDVIELLQGGETIEGEDFSKAMNNFASANIICARPSYSTFLCTNEIQVDYQEASQRLYWGQNADSMRNGDLACKDPAFPGVSIEFFMNVISDPAKMQQMKIEWNLATKSKFLNLQLTPP